MEDLLKKRIGLREVEEYIIRDRRNNKGEEGKNSTFNSKIRKFEEERRMVNQMMRKKLRENGKICTRLRKDRFVAEKVLLHCRTTYSITESGIQNILEQKGTVLV